jgi:plastocyanin
MRLFEAVVVVSLFVAAGFPLAAQTTHTVSQKGKKFTPARLAVHPGDSVEFVNRDQVVHNIFTSSPGFEFNLKRQPPGSSGRVAFEQPGKVEIRCAIHPTMKLTITVE